MLTVRHNRHRYEPKLSHAVFINGLLRDLAGAVGGDKEALLQNDNILIQFEKE
ncbi:MAG: hypothetical protein IKZ56_07105 [Bacteroidales bacterium]|nr:hypothetical protein [Bacteroidales bacterium]